MGYRRLYLFVEGDTDELFVDRVLRARASHEHVHIWRYAQKTKEQTARFLRSVQHIPEADHLFLADLDRAPCVTERKRQLCATFAHLEEERIVVVVPEIEAWYLAGLQKDSAARLKVPTSRSTDGLSKEQFGALIPARSSRIAFMMEILNQYDLEAAVQRNRSLGRLCDRHLPVG